MKLTEEQEKWIWEHADHAGGPQKIINYINNMILNKSSWGNPDIKYKKIKCAAIKFQDTVICGYRHDDCYRNLTAMGIKDEEKWSDWEQGFISLDNEYHNREDSAKIAFENGQISEATEQLFSEDLY